MPAHPPTELEKLAQAIRATRKTTESFIAMEPSDDSRRDLAIARTHLEDAQMRVQHVVDRKERV